MEIFYQYTIGQINFETLGLLFSLMGVVAGITKLGYIDNFTTFFLNKTGNTSKLALFLIGACFFLSMLLTNDVALIVLVPFSIGILNRLNRNDLLIKLLVFETIAANMGSMMTPIGNPQNVYLFQTYQMTLGSFYAAILPYGIVAFLFLLALIFFNFKKEKIAITVDEENSFSKSLKYKRFWSLVFILLFILCLLNILRIVPHYVTFILVLASLFLFDKKTFRTINFNLLIKFVCLFILVGDIAQIPWINSFLSHIISGREIGGGILVSQIVSNVPAAILLSKFTQNSTALLIGVNIGGLGTLIASMASMISLEYYKKTSAANSKKYIASFTKYNLIFLVLELVTAQLAGC